VTIGGTDLSEIDIDAYYRGVSLVSQEAPIFDGTLAENLAHDGTDSERLERVLDAASLTEFVGNLPDGIETRLGERGISVSAGEAQRIALARVLLDEAAYVFLDEPTSALDSETETRVMRGFFEMTSGKTVVLVAHRLQPVRFCDEIVVMDHGSVIERGSFAELMERGGGFRRLWDEQTRQ
jgi:ATP-binding cassette subfamily B protein